MSQMTLRQGIETTLLEEVPELTTILDVTDHEQRREPILQLSGAEDSPGPAGENDRGAPGSAQTEGGRPVALQRAAVPDRR